MFEILDFAYKIIIILMGIGAFGIFIAGFFKGWWKVLDTFKKISLFIDGLFPDVLDDLEKKNILKSGTSSSWSKMLSTGSPNVIVKSPMKIAPPGYQKLEASGFYTIFEEHKSEFFTQLKSKLPTEPPSSYDIEKMAIDVMIDDFDKSYMKPIKDYLYNHPNVLKANMMTLMGLYLRDEYIKSLNN